MHFQTFFGGMSSSACTLPTNCWPQDIQKNGRAQKISVHGLQMFRVCLYRDSGVDKGMTLWCIPIVVSAQRSGVKGLRSTSMDSLYSDRHFHSG